MTLPGSVTSIGSGAFAGCVSLMRVSRPNKNIREMSVNAFPAHTKLIIKNRPGNAHP
ncbi:MAG: leucine-rich repeat domain-containing protein [Oscillospiraceae bacterium]|nr:leucine-rich repeat domain-containing protein [Oscillospiraceae bacterium]